MKKLIIIAVGIFLLAGVFATGKYGISEENISIYEQAVSLEKGDSNFGFEGFAFTDYPVAFYDGDKDHVFVRNGSGYDIQKRAAVLVFTAATAYPSDGGYQVLTPTVEKMSSLVGLFGMGGNSYGREEHTATLWHEAFHCYQLTNYYESIENISPSGVNEGIIAEYADTDEQAVRLYEQQAALLKKSLDQEDIDKLRENIVKYKELEEERRALLSDDVNSAEEYYTRVEGTARYIEASVYKQLLPDSFETHYIDELEKYSNGTEKYYVRGMAMCMLLDRIAPQWKNGYDFSVPLTDIIYNTLEI